MYLSLWFVACLNLCFQSASWPLETTSDGREMSVCVCVGLLSQCGLLLPCVESIVVVSLELSLAKTFMWHFYVHNLEVNRIQCCTSFCGVLMVILPISIKHNLQILHLLFSSLVPFYRWWMEHWCSWWWGIRLVRTWTLPPMFQRELAVIYHGVHLPYQIKLNCTRL